MLLPPVWCVREPEGGWKTQADIHRRTRDWMTANRTSSSVRFGSFRQSPGTTFLLRVTSFPIPLSSSCWLLIRAHSARTRHIASLRLISSNPPCPLSGNRRYAYQTITHTHTHPSKLFRLSHKRAFAYANSAACTSGRLLLPRRQVKPAWR